MLNKSNSDELFHIDGTIRLQSNIIKANNIFGNKFIGEIIKMNPKKFFPSDDSLYLGVEDFQVLVCKDNNEIILGKTRFQVNFKFCEIELVKHFHGLYNIKITPIEEIFEKIHNYDSACIISQNNKSKNAKKKLRNKINKKKQKEIKIVDELIKQCVENRWYGNCIPANIILSELFDKYNIQNNIKKGFKLISNSECKYALWHCWIETNNNKYDICSSITKKIFNPFDKQMENCKEELSEIIPDNFDRIDIDNQEERDTLLLNEKMWKMYKENPSNFWNNKPINKKDELSWNLSVSLRNSMLQNI